MNYPNIPHQIKAALNDLLEQRLPTKHKDFLLAHAWAKHGNPEFPLITSWACNHLDCMDAKRDIATESAVQAGLDLLEPYREDIQAYWSSCKDWNPSTQSYNQSDESLLPLIGQDKSPVVVMNEQHTILPEQENLLPDGYTLASVPATGWDLETIRQKSKKWGDRMVILLSPIPALMSIRAKEGLPFKVFHNDQREKKELPDGRIIHTVAQQGWELV